MIYIPFGLGCYVAQALINNNLRKYSLPFDWCIVDISNVLKIIEHIKNDKEDFKNVLFNRVNMCCWKKLESYVTNSHGPYFRTAYNLIFPHQNLLRCEDKEVLSRRIDRLNECLKQDYTLVVGKHFYNFDYSYDGVVYNDDFECHVNEIKKYHQILVLSECRGSFIKNENWRLVAEQIRI